MAVGLGAEQSHRDAIVLSQRGRPGYRTNIAAAAPNIATIVIPTTIRDNPELD
jgi:hypothetical protein